MTGSTNIHDSLPSTQNAEAGPSTPRSSTPPNQLMRPEPARSGSSRRNIVRVSDAEKAVMGYCGELTGIIVMLDKVISELLSLGFHIEDIPFRS